MLLRAGLVEHAGPPKGREKPYRAVADSIQIAPELRAAGLAGSAQGALIETVTRGFAAHGAAGRFRGTKATAQVEPDTLQQLLRGFFQQVREAEEAALAAGDPPAELTISVFHHPTAG
jgi:hypothetical protein